MLSLLALSLVVFFLKCSIAAVESAREFIPEQSQPVIGLESSKAIMQKSQLKHVNMVGCSGTTPGLLSFSPAASQSSGFIFAGFLLVASVLTFGSTEVDRD